MLDLIFMNRAYIGGWGLFALFALTALVVWFPVARSLRIRSPFRLGVLTVVLFYSSLYAGVKPEPPPGPGPDPEPPPVGPTNAVVIPARRQIGNACFLVWPSGKYEYEGEADVVP